MRFGASNCLLRYYPEEEDIKQAVKEQQAQPKESKELDEAIAQAIGMKPSQDKKYVSFFMEERPQQALYGPKYFVSVLKSYSSTVQQQKRDFTDRVPFKTVHKEPKNFMGGVLGYTMLGEGWIVLRDDLQGDRKHMVDVHESIHTNDEYETRVITDWMLSDEPPRSQQY